MSGAKRKGADAERATRDFLLAQGINCERIPSGTAQDLGDLWVPDWTLEVKWHNDTARAIREGLANLEREQANRQTRWGAVIQRPRGTPDPSCYRFIVTLNQAAQMIRALTPAAEIVQRKDGL